ncbi:hypothetical protein O3682_06395 [Neisseria sp. 27098_8_112]|uniref:hypothetical protein n=1 Tax=Neisseria sp. 27098_8_112 TaxID=3003682 RepID=UPI00352BDA0A
MRLSESWKQWFEQQKTRACVPHTPYTSVLKFVPSAGRGCMAQPRVRLVGMQATACSATHVVLGDWGWRA